MTSEFQNPDQANEMTGFMTGEHNRSLFDRLRSSRILAAGALALSLFMTQSIASDSAQNSMPVITDQQSGTNVGGDIANTVADYLQVHEIGADLQLQHPKRTWIMNARVLNSVSSDPAALSAIKNDRIYGIGFNPNTASKAEKGLDIIPTFTSTSADNIVNAILDKRLHHYVKAILLDIEPWELTPEYQQLHYRKIYKMVGELVRNSHMQFIAPPVPSNRAVKIARDADVVVIQSQFAQSSLSDYKQVMAWRAQKIANENPHALILSGISTNPASGVPNPRMLVRIVENTYGTLVNGYWLNEPLRGGTKSCPHCQPLRADIGRKFLSLLGPAYHRT
ncbi:MAG TPA: hypothetical protein VLG47_07155 [Candidatus Saccharimonadales bacterium]|nr:hypothetical protein [Candidatus Saccharimonadales bacterium]